jgi:hypothetical protein
MTTPNVRIVSNIYPVVTTLRESFDGESYEEIPKEGNDAYFQQITDLEAFKTACDSCSLMPTHDEKPWGRIRRDGELVDICKCTNTACYLYYKECRPELQE